jgi:hypothetical protein
VPEDAAIRSPHLQRLPRRCVTEADRKDPQRRRRAGAARSPLEPEHDSRQSATRKWHPPQRAVHRAPGLESTAVPEGP